MGVNIIAMGEILIDLIPVKPGHYRDVPAFEKCFGGAPFNYAVGVARLGGSVGALTAVGKDPFGEFLLETLEENRVDVSQVKVKDARTTLAFVLLEPSGERSFFFYRQPWVETADTLLSPEDVDPAYFEGAKVLHYSGVALSHSPEREAVFKAVETARQADVMVSYDPNIRLDLWDSVDELRQICHRAMSEADIILMARDEAEFIFGESHPEKIADIIALKYNPQYIAVKLGDKGCYIRDRSGYAVGKPAFKVEVIDTTGAGDGWAAAFEEGLVEGWDLETCAVAANAFGALIVTKRGAITAMPFRNELRRFLDERGFKTGI